jgi:hypothetical protein
MKTSGTCPACQGRLSFWTGLKAPTPFHFRCGQCGARLRVRMRGLWLYLLFLLFLMIGLGTAWVITYWTFGWKGLWIGLAVYLVVWVLIEFVTGVVLYTYGEFAVKRKEDQDGKD